MKDISNLTAEVRIITAPLHELAKQINAGHQLAEQSFRDGLEHARRVGELLLAAKKQAAHGKWLPWLEANVRFSNRTAQRYMRVAEHWSELTANATPVSHLTYRGAIEVLADPRIGATEISVSTSAPNATPVSHLIAASVQANRQPVANLSAEAPLRQRAKDMHARGESAAAIAHALVTTKEKVKEYLAAPDAPAWHQQARETRANGMPPRQFAQERGIPYADVEAFFEADEWLDAARTAKPQAVLEMPINNITFEDRLQAGVTIPDQDAEEYSQILDKLPPCAVFTDGETTWMVSGFIRAKAHRLAGRETMRVELYLGTFKEAFVVAMSANRRNGLRPTRKDRELVAKRSVELGIAV